MRTVFITSLLALALIISASAAPHGATTSTCCPKLFKGKIPANMVVSFGSTRSDCAKKALMITTVAARVFCVDPDQDWVKSVVDKLKREADTAASQV
ncbi:C-C motif chemokine 5-like [Engraulis encrasicolus]|uniref:C-C motif chemokine 5-like n=1 Tax=Engraulis encrasicolus TaxID=184585 RepID=UPI002FCF8645